METLTELLGSNWNMWLWMISGVLIFLAELLFIPGSYIMWFGLGAFLTGILTGIIGSFTDVSYQVQFLIFAILSAVSYAIGIRVYRQFFGQDDVSDRHRKTGTHRYVGDVVTVCEDFEGFKGKVTVLDTQWLAKSSQNFKVGDKVVVEDVNGTVLVVGEIKNENN